MLVSNLENYRNNQNFENRLDQLYALRNPAWFAGATKLIYKDLNNSTRSDTFYQYTKDQIATFIQDPSTNEQQLRAAVVNLYHASSHFRRLIKYFAGLTNWSYVVSPINVSEQTDVAKLKEDYQKTVELLSGTNIRSQGAEAITVALREDSYFATAIISNDNVISLQQLDSNYCKIASSEDNVFNVSFDFSYFDTSPDDLQLYPKEFTTKYRKYQSDSQNKWIELDSPTSFAIKCNSDFPTYSVPPFVGVLREVYDLEDYKALKLSKTELENYAVLVLENEKKDGKWTLPLTQAVEFANNLGNAVPEQVGVIATPMKVDKIDFENSGTAESDKITESEKHLWASAGVSGQVFSSESNSSRALELSIMADQALTWEIANRFSLAINRILHAQSFGANFSMVLMDVSRYNQKDMMSTLTSTTQYGFPTRSLVLAVAGVEPVYMTGLNYLETQILDFPNTFIPLRSSNTASSGTVGAPTLDDSDASDETQRSRDNQ